MYFYSICIRDTAGQERFHTITTSYYRGAMVCVRERERADRGWGAREKRREGKRGEVREGEREGGTEVERE